MIRREFLVTSALGTAGAVAHSMGVSESGAAESNLDIAAYVDGMPTAPMRTERATRKILIAGGGFGTAFIRYMAQLTGKPRPRLLYLPTASADRDASALNWYKACAPLNVEPHVQNMFIASTAQSLGWDEVLLSMDGIVASGGNTLNQQAI